jgi:hypothetical protein
MSAVHDIATVVVRSRYHPSNVRAFTGIAPDTLAPVWDPDNRRACSADLANRPDQGRDLGIGRPSAIRGKLL